MADPNTAAAVIEQPHAPAAPSEPTSAPPVAERKSTLTLETDDERQAWARDGKLPDRLNPFGKKPAADPAKPTQSDDDALATDAQGQPIRGTDGKFVSKRQQATNDRIRQGIEQGIADYRRQTDARIAELEARARGTQPAQPAAEPQQPNQPQPAAQPEDKEPTIEDFPIEKYLDQPDPYFAQMTALTKAVAKYEFKQEQKAEAERTATKQRDEAQHAAIQRDFTSYQAREDAFKKDVPDFDTRTLQFRNILNFQDPLSRAILLSEKAPQLILHLAERPDDVRRIGALAGQDFTAALRALVTIEHSFSTPAAPAASAPAAATPKTISDAPSIGTTLGSQPAAAADASASAVARKDFAAFAEIETAKELERFRRKKGRK